MAVMGTLAEGCDITPSLRSGFQMLHEKSKLQQGGGPGGLMVVQACVVEDVLEPEINKETWAEDRFVRGSEDFSRERSQTHRGILSSYSINSPHNMLDHYSLHARGT